jgi:hypothetical protein
MGKLMEAKLGDYFDWVNDLKSFQYNDVDLQKVKAFILTGKGRIILVISSPLEEQSKKLLKIMENTRKLLSEYNMYKGWFGASTLLKSVTCAPGHPLEVIGRGMNEGVSWFIFDGYMDFLAKNEIENWVKEVQLPVVANVGFSPIYGCSDYNGLQVQDMSTKQAWIDYAHGKGGYAFRPVYDPASDDFVFDGYIVNEGNKEQIDNENVPFINRTGMLSDNLIPSMMLFIEKAKPLSNESIWDAILSRREVAVLEQAQMMGPELYRNALELLYLDNEYLTDYFQDKIDVTTEMDGYNLKVNIRNYHSMMVKGSLNIVASPAIQIERYNQEVELNANESKQVIIPLNLSKDAMGKTNPIAVHFKMSDKTKSTMNMLDMPPAISVNQLLYGNAPKVNYPVTVHNFTNKADFPVKLEVYKTGSNQKPAFTQTKTFKTDRGTFQQQNFELELPAGSYDVVVAALDCTSKSQLGVGESSGKCYAYEVDLNSDGINEYRLQNDSVQITLLRTGARVIEYIVKSRNDNVLFKAWPEKTYNDKRPFRKRGYYPFGGF